MCLLGFVYYLGLLLLRLVPYLSFGVCFLFVVFVVCAGLWLKILIVLLVYFEGYIFGRLLFVFFGCVVLVVCLVWLLIQFIWTKIGWGGFVVSLFNRLFIEGE